MPSTPTIISIIGPTAVGKTDVAMALADRFAVDIISMDSAMVYRQMDIGTAKPSAIDLANYPHALVDIRDPGEPYSAADFLADSDEQVRASLAAGRIPVLVGGTMLYAKVFREGIGALPSANLQVREDIVQKANTVGWPVLHQQLEQIDPIAAQQIHPNNHQRLARALEVYEVSGQVISHWWREHPPVPVHDRHMVGYQEFAVMPAQRSQLHARIEERFEAMIEQGFVDEVRSLRDRGDLSLSLPALRAVGYRQVWQYLDDSIDFTEMLRTGKSATRQLAKRQFTWLRAWTSYQSIQWGDAQNIAAEIAAVALVAK